MKNGRARSKIDQDVNVTILVADMTESSVYIDKGKYVYIEQDGYIHMDIM